MASFLKRDSSRLFLKLLRTSGIHFTNTSLRNITELKNYYYIEFASTILQ